MLATLLTGLFLAVQALGQLGRRLSREEPPPPPPPYLVHQPLPWQLHSVTQGRRGSRDGGKGSGSRHNSTQATVAGRRGDASSESTEASDPAAVTIQAHYHKYHQHKHQE